MRNLLDRVRRNLVFLRKNHRGIRTLTVSRRCNDSWALRAFHHTLLREVSFREVIWLKGDYKGAPAALTITCGLFLELLKLSLGIPHPNVSLLERLLRLTLCFFDVLA